MSVETLKIPCGGPALATLRRFDTGELAGADREAVASHAGSCASCRAVLEDFTAERSAALVSMPFSRFEARLERRPSALQRWLRTASLWLALPALGAAVALFAIRSPVDDGAGIRVKGTRFDFVVKSGDLVHDGVDAEALHPGDAVRFRYRPETMDYILIVGIDADGNVFPYLADGTHSVATARGAAKILAPNAVTLDDDPRPERVFALFSKAPIDIDEVRPAAKDAVKAGRSILGVKELPLGLSGVDQATVLLNKAR